MGRSVWLTLSDEDSARLDRAVAEGRFETRAAALRAGLRAVLRIRSDDEIAEAYRRAYTEHPDEGWIGEVGAALAGQRVKDLRRRGD